MTVKMTVDHVNAEVFDELFGTITGELATPAKTKTNSKIRFFENRIKFLDDYAENLEQQEKQLRAELYIKIQDLISDMGAEILSLQQLKTLAWKESGACEAHIMELKEELEKGETND